MRIEDMLGSTQPGLIITYGNTRRKVRPLDRDVLLIGQAPGCDLQLKSPDVHPVHLVILRLPDGWRLRDCTGRGATRLNGKAFTDERLHDGDVVQLSTFSFHLHLPDSCRPVSAGPRVGPRDTVLNRSPPQAPLGDAAVLTASARAENALLGRLQRSRKNMIRLALNLRERHQQAQAAALQVQQQLGAREAEQEAQQREADALLRDLKSRVRQLEQKEAELRSRRTALEQEHTERHEKEAEAKARLSQLQTELEGRQSHPESPEAPVDQEALQCWRIRAIELEHLVRHLRQSQRSDPHAAQQLQEQIARVQRLEEELDQARHDNDDRPAYEADLNRFRLELEKDRADLNDQLALLQMKALEIERLSRERTASLDLDRMEIEREREQLRQEREQWQQEREQRPAPAEPVPETKDAPPTAAPVAAEVSLRDRLAHLQKLKEEFAGRRQGMTHPTSPAKTP